MVDKDAYLREILSELNTLENSWAIRLDNIKHEINGNLNKPVPNTFFYYYPLLFLGTEDVLGENIAALLKFNTYYFIYLQLFDNQLDRQNLDENIQLKIHIFHEKALNIASRLFESGNDFWKYLHKYQKEYFDSFSGISQNGKNRNETTIEEFTNIAKGKTAVAKICFVSYALLFKCSELIPIINMSQELVHTGLQIIDDLQDWKGDYAKKKFTFLINQIINRTSPEEDSSFNNNEIQRLSKILYKSGVATEVLEIAVNCFEEAYSYVRDLNFPVWISAIKFFKSWCMQRIEEINAINKRAESINAG